MHLVSVQGGISSALNIEVELENFMDECKYEISNLDFNVECTRISGETQKIKSHKFWLSINFSSVSMNVLNIKMCKAGNNGRFCCPINS